jgi:hypothetical protein
MKGGFLMENASKALIIAGAILVSILIISLGIIIYQQASGIINGNAMSEADTTTFNAKFLQYQGSKVSGATVNAMLQAVLANNVTQDDTTKKIEVTGDLKLSSDSTSATTSASTSATYTVSLSHYNSYGLVDQIKVTKNN